MSKKHRLRDGGIRQARRKHTCKACGKVTRGNLATASHRKACGGTVPRGTERESRP